MPGTLVRDALAPTLLNAVDVDNSNDDGSAVEVNKPGDVAVVLTTGAVTGTNPTLDIEIQGSDDSTFATDVVSYGRFPQLTAAATTERVLNAKVYKRYMRALVTAGGTTPVFNDVTVKVRQPHDRRTTSTTA